jgi:hypothetical protein
MYGHTLEDIDMLWRQGDLNQNQHQLLKTWAEKCGLMVMGPRCLDCPHALLRNPRPGRPEVIETENWLEAKHRMHWDDMKAAKDGKKIDEPDQQQEILRGTMATTGEKPSPGEDEDLVESKNVKSPNHLDDGADDEPESKRPVLSQDIIEALADD